MNIINSKHHKIKLIFVTLASLLYHTNGQAQMGEYQFDNGLDYGHWLVTVDSSWHPIDDIDPVAGFRPVAYSEFTINRKVGTSEINFSNASQENERLSQFGFGYKNFDLQLFSGYGQSTSRVNSRFNTIDPYQFHGGIDQRFRYDGFGLGRNIGRNSSISYNWARITANDVDDRVVHSIGATIKRTELALMAVSRGGERVGAAASLSTMLRNQFVGYDYMKQENGASYQGVNYKTNYNGVNYQVQFQKTKNPLYLEKNDNRLLFSVGFTLGKRYDRMRATDAETEETETRNPNNKFIIAGGVVGAGVILSSGSSHSDDSARFSGQHGAAFEVLNRINPVSVRENLEYGGYVYRNADGSFSSTEPIKGGPASVTLPPISSVIPGNAVARGSYHTHAGPDPRFDNENFSPTDINTSIALSIDGYLGTPGGLFKYFDLNQRTIRTLGTIAN